MTVVIPRLSHKANAVEAEIWLKDMACRIGLGFHPDTHGKNYVNDDGSRTLSEESARALDHGLLVCRDLMDVYDVAVDALNPMIAEAQRTYRANGGM